MNKKLIALAVASVFAGYGAVSNAATVSGFALADYTLTNDSAAPTTPCTPSGDQPCLNSKEGKFVVDAEIDITATPADGVTVRVDTDLKQTTNAGAGSAASLEQAFFAWDLAPVTLVGGIFNNPIGQEAQDAPDWNFVHRSQIHASLDHQTALYGNNVSGVAVAGDVGPVTITGAYLNDIGEANEENSLALVLNSSPIAGLDLEFGLVTHDEDTDGVSTTAETVGDVMDFNVQYAPAAVAGLAVGLDYASYDKIADTAYNLWGTYAIPSTHFSVGVRLESFSWESAGATSYQDTETTTFQVAYHAASNLHIALEVRDTEGANCPVNATCTGVNYNGFANAMTGAKEDGQVTLELLATF